MARLKKLIKVLPNNKINPKKNKENHPPTKNKTKNRPINQPKKKKTIKKPPKPTNQKKKHTKKPQTHNLPETEAVCIFGAKYSLFIMGSSCDSI